MDVTAEDDLARFVSWLQAHGRSESTATGYAKVVRYARANGVVNLEDVDEAFAHKTSSRRWAIRSGVRTFGEFLEAEA